MLLLHVGRQYLGVVAPCVIAASGHGFANNHPRVVVAEDAGILLVAFRVGTQFAHLHVVGGVGRVVEHNAVLTLHAFLHRVERLVHKAVCETDTRHRTPALTLNEYFALFVFVTPDFVAEEVVGTEKPVAVPAMLLYGLLHVAHGLCHALGLLVFAEMSAEFHVVFARHDKQTGYHETFRLGALALVFGGLEALVGIP